MNAGVLEQRIVLTLADEPGTMADIHSTRLLHVGRLFQGKPGEHVSRIVSRLFTLCGNAHAAAAALCLGQVRDERRMTQLQVRVLAENLREHLLRILMIWPGLLEEPVDVSHVSRANALSSTLLAADHRPGGIPAHSAVPGRTLDELVQLTNEAILGTSPEAFLEIGPEAFAAWLEAGQTQAARFIARISRMNLPSPPDMPRLARADLPAIAARLDGEDVETFVARPELADGCRATGTACAHPRLPADACPAAAAPFLERLFCLCRLLRDLGHLAAGLAPEHAPLGRQGDTAYVETSRGLLVHQARLDAGDRVEAYHILAPTEWNFHPRGIAARWLAQLDPQDEGRERLAGLIVHAVDPCVTFEIRSPETPRGEVAAHA